MHKRLIATQYVALEKKNKSHDFLQLSRIDYAHLAE